MPPKRQRPPPRRRPRKYKKRKPAYKKKKYSGQKLQVTREVKFVETLTESHEVKYQLADSTHMENGALIYPSGYNADQCFIPQGTGCHEMLGCWIRPLYALQKFTIDFSGLDLTHADTMKGLRLRCRYGWVRNTGAKSGATLATTPAAWQIVLNSMVVRELQDAKLDSDYTTFQKKSRNIMIEKDFFVRPRNPAVIGKSNTLVMSPPEYNMSISWNKTKGWLRNKTRLEPTTQATTHLVLHNTFVPFVYFSCEQATAHTGKMTVESSSRYYYTDA